MPYFFAYFDQSEVIYIDLDSLLLHFGMEIAFLAFALVADSLCDDLFGSYFAVDCTSFASEIAFLLGGLEETSIGNCSFDSHSRTRCYSV